MKILQVCHSFYPCFDSGGVVRVTYELSKSLVKKGHEVTVYTTDGCTKRLNVKTDVPVDVDGIKVFYFRNLSNYLRVNAKLATPYRLLYNTSRIKDFDIIHFHEHRTLLTLIIQYYARKYNIPYIIQAHGSVDPNLQKKGLKNTFDLLFGNRILKDASKLLALTTIESNQYIQKGVPEDKIKIVSNGISLDDFENLPPRMMFRNKFNIDGNKKIILYLGRIHPTKGIRLLLKAFVELSEELPDAILVIVGPKTEYYSVIENDINQLGLKNKVLLPGPLYEREKLEAFVDADVYVLPSLYETFPLSVLEALACGTPIVITDRCGIADMVDNLIGCVAKYDKYDLSKAIANILQNGETVKEFRRNSQIKLKNSWNWEAITNNFEEIYKGAINKQLIS